MIRQYNSHESLARAYKSAVRDECRATSGAARLTTDNASAREKRVAILEAVWQAAWAAYVAAIEPSLAERARRLEELEQEETEGMTDVR